VDAAELQLGPDAQREALAWQLLEARREAAHLRTQVHLLQQVQQHAGSVPLASSSPHVFEFPPVAQVPAAPGVEALLRRDDSHHMQTEVDPWHRINACELTLTVKNTFVDVVNEPPEHHRRTWSVPPRNQWLPLSVQLDAASDRPL